MDPKMKELLKEFEKEIVCMCWDSIEVYGPILKLMTEDTNITLTKIDNKYFLEYEGPYDYKIGLYKSPDEIRKVLKSKEALEEMRKLAAEEPPLSESQKEAIRKGLRVGKDIYTVSREVETFPLVVYEFAKKENLPINLPIKYIGETERR